MKCPNCPRDLHLIESVIYHCPTCGTLRKRPGMFITPTLVYYYKQRKLEFPTPTHPDDSRKAEEVQP